MGTPHSKQQVGLRAMEGMVEAVNFPALAALAAEKVAAGKSPGAVIYELGLKNRLVCTMGKPHCPVFKYEIMVGHKRYVGKATTKRHARAKAAQLCVDDLLILNMSLRSSVMAATVPHVVVSYHEAGGSTSAGASGFAGKGASGGAGVGGEEKGACSGAGVDAGFSGKE